MVRATLNVSIIYANTFAETPVGLSTHAPMFLPTFYLQKHSIVLAHGLLGFDELRLAGPYFPGIHYWRGIKEALSHKGIDVMVAAVPPSGSIEARAEKLAQSIARTAKGKEVNIIAYVTGDPLVEIPIIYARILEHLLTANHDCRHSMV
jgi:hypothetical protein